MMKKSLEKRPSVRQTLILSLTSPEISIPPHFDMNNGKSMGFWRSNWLHLRGRSIDWTERIKTCLRSVGGRTYGRPDERINSSDAGRMRRNCRKVFRINKLE